MSDEKMQTSAEYKIRAYMPRYYYNVFKGTEYDGNIVFAPPSWRLEMNGGGKKIINDVRELLELLPKKEGEEIAVSEEQMKKYTQVKITPDGGKELTFVAELGCNCGSCDRRCHLKYDGEIVALEVGGEERYFAK
ncbi:MAG: hypothetical protein WA139_05415 [Candidatus Aenigmatarchaeota archaeon]